jgi:hypothetical protein
LSKITATAPALVPISTISPVYIRKNSTSLMDYAMPAPIMKNSKIDTFTGRCIAGSSSSKENNAAPAPQLQH